MNNETPAIDQTIDLSELTITAEHAPARPRKKPPQPKSLYIPGPIYLTEIREANTLGGACLAVSLLLRMCRNWQKSSEYVKIAPTIYRQLGLNRHQVYRALNKMEAAGMVELRRHKGEGTGVKQIHQHDGQ